MWVPNFFSNFSQKSLAGLKNKVVTLRHGFLIQMIMKQVEERYISLLTDFGFKRIFGTAIKKDLLICFLNSLFNGRQVVKDVIVSESRACGRCLYRPQSHL